MSLKTLLQKIGSDISELFNKTVHELETVILPAAIAVTNLAKTITEGDSTDVIGKLAGAAGAALEDKLRATLEAITPKLQLAQQFLSSGGTASDILAQVIKAVGSSSAFTKTAFYIEFSGLVAQDLAAGALTTGEAVQLAQYFYKNYPSASAATEPVAAPAAAPASNS